jgi:uncharacterized membrane protein YphA (DoxX/SURF4 family)
MIDAEKIRSLWQRIWFEPTSPAPFCMYRILFGAIVLLATASKLFDINLWYSTKGIVSVAAAKQFAGPNSLSLFFLIEPTSQVVLIAMLVLMLASATLCIGYKTRLSAFLVWFLVLSFNNRNQAILNCGDIFTQISALLLMLGPAEAMYSVDRKNRGDQDQVLAEPWAQRLLQVQIAAVYVAGFFWKYGQSWWNGTATYYAMNTKAYVLWKTPYIFDQLWTIQLTTWGTLAIEFSLFTLIWIKELRPWVLLAGLILHIGLLFTMNFAFLQLLMIASYINFLSPANVEKFARKLRLQT